MPKLTPPYPAIRNALLKGRVIPFLGAGASFGSRNPGQTPWRVQKGPRGEWEVAYLPTASELAECLAQEASFPADEGRELTKVAQYYHAVIGRQGLTELLHDIFTFSQPTAPIHEYLAEVAKQVPLLAVTTNYDDLIERAFAAAGVKFDTVVHAVDVGARGGELLWRPHGGSAPQQVLAKDLDIDLASVSVVYKIHGAVDRTALERDQFVITEDDYVDFLTRMTRNSAIPNIFAEPFQTRPFLFLGYGLYDWNLRVVLNRIHSELRRPTDIRSWAIETRSKPLEKKLWDSRNVVVFDEITIDEFVANLRGVAPAPPGTPAGRSP